MARGLWVTGTDTGVGKTLVTGGLVRALRRSGLGSVAGLKPLVSGAWLHGDPVASGAKGGACTWEDLERLAVADGLALPPEERAVYRFLLPASPHLAAAAEGEEVDRRVLLEGIARAQSKAEFSVIEGVGGFRVPVAPGFDTADLAVWLGLPVVLVVGLRLGCINHALLTGEAIAARGLRLAAWVANGGVDPSYRQVDETIETLEEGLGVVCGARLGHVPGPVDAERLGPVDAWRAAVEAQTSAVAGALAGLASRLTAP